MKMRIWFTGIGIVVFCTALFFARLAWAQSNYGQVSMQNNTKVTLDLYVDKEYGCRALKNLSCTVQERVGEHVLMATGAGGFKKSKVVELKQGSVYTWTVTEELQK